MIVNFCVRGRLGNAIFRYMASTIICLYYNGEYSINNNQQYNCSDERHVKSDYKRNKYVNYINILKIKY